MRLDDRHGQGCKFLEEGRYEEALLEFTRAIFLCPGSAAFHASRAETYLTLLDLKSSISNYRKAVSLDSGTQTIECFIEALFLSSNLEKRIA
jgi:Tfp pilus assembly protein PilF